ncbi:hypothetical protein E2F46_02225 [Luteimonas aestuarii]|uniref:Uncharacterized protein n=1 Tax=Luteimonas aestuarii TaxID=453837 RepID=A0A4R5U4L7_9GAMM|nr:hypothetical protein [Luteimonas aestuarii]TDK28700.1 hypothetical protein E2F46_02225 [Luteimonas aestuarii]
MHSLIFAVLSDVLRKHAGGLSIRTDRPGNPYVEAPARAPKAKAAFFGVVQARKSYVGLSPDAVYEDPGLLDGIGDGLRGRMQGESCFNFEAVDPVPFKELDQLTKRCAASVEGRPGVGRVVWRGARHDGALDGTGRRLTPEPGAPCRVTVVAATPRHSARSPAATRGQGARCRPR